MSKDTLKKYIEGFIPRIIITTILLYFIWINVSYLVSLVLFYMMFLIEIIIIMINILNETVVQINNTYKKMYDMLKEMTSKLNETRL
jgi:hypothetical protein